MFHQAIKIYNEGNEKSESDELYIYTNMGDNYRDMAYFIKADSTYNLALIKARSVAGNNSKTVADIMSQMSQLYYLTAKFDKAKESISESMRIYEKLEGKKSEDYLFNAIDLINIEMALSQYDKAETKLLDILATVEANYDHKCPLAAHVYDRLCDLYKDFDDYEKAKLFSENSLTARQYWFGEWKLMTATSYSKRAYVYYWGGEYQMADSLYEKAARIERFYLGYWNQNYAASVNGLGLVYTAKGKLLDADTIFGISKKILNEIVSEEHPDLATVLNNIGYLRLKQKLYDEAESSFLSALLINKKNFNEVHLSIAENLLGLGEVKKEAGKYPEARKYYEESMNVYRKLFKFKHHKIDHIREQLKKIP